MTKITFKANKNTVTANTYVAHALYKQNEAIVNELGGEVLRGVGGFKAQFKSAANAKKFVEQAVTSISKREYNASRKTTVKVTEPKKAPKQGKGKSKADFIVLTDSEGNEYQIPMSALGIKAKVSTQAPKTGKGKNAHKPMSGRVAMESEQKLLFKAKKGKGSSKGVDFSKLAGKGRSANKQAAELIYKTGCKPNSAEFNTLWAQWVEVR